MFVCEWESGGTASLFMHGAIYSISGQPIPIVEYLSTEIETW